MMNQIGNQNQLTKPRRHRLAANVFSEEYQGNIVLE
jgi:hypothetical protein